LPVPSNDVDALSTSSGSISWIGPSDIDRDEELILPVVAIGVLLDDIATGRGSPDDVGQWRRPDRPSSRSCPTSEGRRLHEEGGCCGDQARACGDQSGNGRDRLTSGNKHRDGRDHCRD
jgi:hypothetical protein